MKRFRLSLSLLCATALVLVAAGCIQKREEGKNRTVLKAGAQCADELDGWVGVPNTQPKEATAPDKSFTYARLATHNVVPDKMDGWWAMSPKLFEKVTGVKLDPQDTKAGEMWAMKAGRRVPKDKEGWIGVPLRHPKVEAEGDAGLAQVGADNLIPKEMDGWAAVDTETMVKLAEKKNLQGLIPAKKKAPEGK